MLIQTFAETAKMGKFFLLGVVLLALNFTGVISIPWIWAFAPFWIPAAMIAFVLSVFVITCTALATLAPILADKLEEIADTE